MSLQIEDSLNFKVILPSRMCKTFCLFTFQHVNMQRFPLCLTIRSLNDFCCFKIFLFVFFQMSCLYKLFKFSVLLIQYEGKLTKKGKHIWIFLLLNRSRRFKELKNIKSEVHLMQVYWPFGRHSDSEWILSINHIISIKSCVYLFL